MQHIGVNLREPWKSKEKFSVFLNSEVRNMAENLKIKNNCSNINQKEYNQSTFL